MNRLTKWVIVGLVGIIGIQEITAKSKELSDKERIANLEMTIGVVGELVGQQQAEIDNLAQRTLDLREWIEELGGGPDAEPDSEPPQPQRVI